MSPTPRQLEFVALTANGSTLRDIEASEHVEYSTVRNALADARKRSGARTNAQLVCKLLAKGELVLCEDGTVRARAARSGLELRAGRA